MCPIVGTAERVKVPVGVLVPVRAPASYIGKHVQRVDPLWPRGPPAPAAWAVAFRSQRQPGEPVPRPQLLALAAVGALAACRAPATIGQPAATTVVGAVAPVVPGAISPAPDIPAGEDGPTAHATEPPLAIAYRLTIADPAAHLFAVRMDVDGVRGDALELQLPVWSPGRYARFDFARNVQELDIADADGHPLTVERRSGSRWRVHTTGVSHVIVRYRAFWNNLSGTFSVLDTAHANWNGASLFMYVVGHKPDPVTLHVDRPAGWHIINGDARTPDQTDYRFENYDRLIDTPTEVAPSFMVDSFTVDGRLYRTMVHHNGEPPAGARRQFVGDVEKIVRYENSVFGPPPLSMYTFLFNIGYDGGDGMEHLYSTEIIDSRPWSVTEPLLSGVATAAHEYFHVWNVKRVRPLLLGPFDYTRERYQPSLWVAEGWTQYYGEVALYRAGVLPADGFLATMARYVQSNLTAPGRREVSARMASFEAPFWDGAPRGAYETNGRNTFFSYYVKGAGLALYLDLLIRERSGNTRALDDAFRDLRRLSWDQPNASYYLQGRGYTEGDVERAVSEAAGTDLHAWFDTHVGGTEDVDYDAVLAGAGLALERSSPEWRIVPVAGATPAQLRVRAGWETGRVDR